MNEPEWRIHDTVAAQTLQMSIRGADETEHGICWVKVGRGGSRQNRANVLRPVSLSPTSPVWGKSKTPVSCMVWIQDTSWNLSSSASSLLSDSTVSTRPLPPPCLAAGSCPGGPLTPSLGWVSGSKGTSKGEQQMLLGVNRRVLLWGSSSES